MSFNSLLVFGLVILFHLNLFFAFTLTQEEIENANGFGGSC